MKQAHLHHDQEIQNQFGRHVAARLSDGVNDLPYDISERLRAARVRAVDQRRWVLTQAATELFAQDRAGTLTAGQGHSSWWSRLGGAGLLVTLVLGLFFIQVIQDEQGARELADIDAAILTDDLPPAAYVDPGFTQFLKSGFRREQ